MRARAAQPEAAVGNPTRFDAMLRPHAGRGPCAGVVGGRQSPLSAVPGRAHADAAELIDNEHYTLRAEPGVEFDSNAHRTEQIRNTQLPAETRSFLQRFVLSSQLTGRG